MTLETLFLLLVPTYLVLIAYGVVGSRRRRLSPRARLVAVALMLLIPLAAILAALYATGDAFVIAGWGFVTLVMFVFGIVTAFLADYIARRTGA